MSHTRIPHFWAWLLGLALHAPLAAQLDLPKKGGAGDTAVRKVTAREKKQALRGLDLPRRVRGDLAPGSKRPVVLSIPKAGPRDAVAETRPLTPTLGAHFTARGVLETLAKSRDPHGAVAREATQALIDLGPAGLAAARVGLASNQSPTLWVCGRFLLSYGGPEDRGAYALRLRRRVPANIGGGLVRELVQTDPVLASPTYLTELLDHPTGAVRQSAFTLLKARPEHLPFAALVFQMEAKRSATRLAALQLLAVFPDRLAVNVIAAALDDASAKVAAEAAALLAPIDHETITDLLRARAFPGAAAADVQSLWRGPTEREQAYAVLSLVQREQRQGRSFFLDEDVPVLLQALDSRLPILAGAAAVALAGIGFRSPLQGTAWLDREVPHLLLRFGAGVEYHNDLSSLIQPASERLALLSGESFGMDARAWRHWWLSHAEDFVARRGAIAISEAETSMLELDCSTAVGGAPSAVAAVRFIGPAVPTPASEQGVIYLNAAESSELVALLRAQRVLSADRVGDGRIYGLRKQFVIRVGNKVKTLSYDVAHRAAWLEVLEGRLERLSEHHLWQQYADLERHVNRREFWELNNTWWDEATPRKRSRRLKDLMLTELLSAAREKAGTFKRLTTLYLEPEISEAADFPGLFELLGREPLWNARARTLFKLARMSAMVATPAAARQAGVRIDPESGEQLLRATIDRFGRAAEQETSALLEELGVPRVRAAALEREVELRRLAAELLPGFDSEEDRTLAFALCDDADARVAEAALLSLGSHGIESARDLLQQRVSVGEVRVRAAALVALARLGGDEVGDLALEALAERDPVLQKAAVEALAELSDPAHASLLAALFSRGPDSLLFEPAQRGLLRLGPSALREVLRLTHSQTHTTRRAAALLLARQGVPEAASNLMTMLTQTPGDLRVRDELAILTCVDFTRAADPVEAYWGWWDEVVHDDSLLWLQAAAARQGFTAPDGAEFEGEGNESGARFLLDLFENGSYPLTVRAQRELARLLHRESEKPRDEAARTLLIEVLSDEIAEVYGR